MKILQGALWECFITMQAGIAPFVGNIGEHNVFVTNIDLVDTVHIRQVRCYLL